MGIYYAENRIRERWNAVREGEVEVWHNEECVKICKDSNEAFRYIHDNQFMSIDWAMTYEHWDVKPHIK